METFSWLSDLRIAANGSAVMATGAGFVTMDGSEGAVAAVTRLKARRPGAGRLLSATALLYLDDGRERRLVMTQRDDSAHFEPGKWQFPAGHLYPDELPLTCACRKLFEEVRIDGDVTNWREVRVVVGGHDVDFLPQDAAHSIRARYVVANNTVEFYYPMTHSVRAFDRVKLADNESYGRKVGLFTAQAVAELAAAGSLTAAARMIAELELPNGAPAAAYGPLRTPRH